MAGNGHTPDSLVQKIARRKRAGDTNARIAEATGIPESTVKNVCHRRHIRLRSNNRLVYKVAPELHEACNTEARRRNLTINAFLRQMLEKIVEDKLFNAIFDDGK
jgi:predicted HicB family RNase H-like nuclease